MIVSQSAQRPIMGSKSGVGKAATPLSRGDRQGFGRGANRARRTPLELVVLVALVVVGQDEAGLTIGTGLPVSLGEQASDDPAELTQAVAPVESAA
jgi:hypothetical protein